MDAAVVVQTGWVGYCDSWPRRLFTNMLANLKVVPTIVVFGLNGASLEPERSLARYIEAGLLSVGIF